MTALQTYIGQYKLRERYPYAGKSGYGFPPSALPTEDDLPCDDGEPMETAQHHEQMDILIYSLRSYWEKSRRYYIGGNMFLHFDPDRKRKFVGPDVFLVTDTDDRMRKSWVVWQEGKFPDLIVELLSDSTRKTDKTEKKHLYEQVFGTSEYYIYDPFSHEFEGYRLSGGRYRTVKPDREKKIWSPVTGLWLIVKDGLLRWMTEDGHILPTPDERAGQEKLRAEQEKHRAEQAEHRAEQEQQRAEQEKLRAEQEQQRAEQAEHRADRLAAKLREMGISPELI